MTFPFDARFAAWIAVAVVLIVTPGYGYVVSRARSSRIGVRIRKGLERVTGAVMIGLGARLALERR